MPHKIRLCVTNGTTSAQMKLGILVHSCATYIVTPTLSLKGAKISRYAAKLDSEGAAMYDAAKALKQAMIELGVACDGGKDSLSMAANVAGEVCLLSLLLMSHHMTIWACTSLKEIHEAEIWCEVSR